MPAQAAESRPSGSLGVRLATGLALASALAAAALYLPSEYFAAFLIVFGLVAAYEWARLAGISGRRGWLAFSLTLAALVTALWLLPGVWPLALWAVAAFWVLAAIVVLAYPRGGAMLRSTPVMLACGAFAIVGGWLAVIRVHGDVDRPGAQLVLWLLLAAAVADTGAYFAGRRFGRHRLAAEVSPGKTWEGALGGAACTLLWGVCGALWFGGSWLLWLGASALVWLASVFGDLFESAFKRSRGAKDSGGILPGHGGVLDRADSALAAAPVFALLVPVLV